MASEIYKIHKDLQNGKITCTDLIGSKLDLLAKSKNQSANLILKDYALELAAKVDDKIKQGKEIGLLEGIPFGIKDVFLLQGFVASASSNILKNYLSPYTATAIQKLLDVGAIPIVKENCDAFGHGSSSENTIFGAVENAVFEGKVAGGSSGGSAVNVAKNITVFSIGGDTGGSIRQPAGFNKIYGLKPTFGRVSRYGIMAYASSTDCVGPIASSVEDIAIVLNCISGKDYHDQTSIESKAIDDRIFERDLSSKIKVGYYKSFLENEALDPKLKADFIQFIDQLKENHIEVEALEMFDANTLVSTYYMIAMAETASNLSRLDGTNFGLRGVESNLKMAYAITRSENFSEETKRRIVGGNQVLSEGYSDDIYLKARALREKISAHFTEDFEKVDVILSPVAPNLPPEMGYNIKEPLSMYMSDAYTVGFSLGGIPTLSAPFATEIGVQISAAKNNESLILEFAKFIENI